MIIDENDKLKQVEMRSKLRTVWLYDKDASAREAVDSDKDLWWYKNPAMRQEDAWDVWGKDYARVDGEVPEHLKHEPMGLCEFEIDSMAPEKQEGWRTKLDSLRSSGASKKAYYALYAGMKREQVQGAYDERKAREEEQRKERAMIDGFGDMVGDLVRGKKAVGDLSPEWLELLQRGGVSLGDLDVAGQAYSMVGDKGADEMNYYDAVKTLRGNEKSRNLLLSVIAEDAMREQKERSSGSVVRQAGEAALSFGKDVYRFGADVVQKGLLGNSRNQRSMLAAFRTGVSSDEKDALIGAVNGARDEGVQMEKEGRGFKMIDMFDSIASFGSMALKFTNPGTAALEAANMYESNKNSMLNSSRTYEVTDEMYEEWVQELVRGGMSVEEALEEAEKMKAEAEREVDPLKVSGKAALYAGIEYASMKAGLGAARGLAGRFVPAVYRGMTKATRGVAASRYGIGAFGLGVGATMFDVGVAMPAVSGAGKLAVDQIPGLDDAKISTGKEELAAWWDNVGKMRYWGEQLGAGLLGGLIGARGRMLGARQHLGERRAAILDGMSGEQYDKIMHLEPGKRFAEWDRIVQENKEKDFEETMRRSIKAYGDAVNHELARQKRADEATRAALQMYGMDFAPGEKPGEVVMYYGGRVEGGKFVRGEKKVVMTEAEADVYVAGVMRARIDKTVKELKNAAGNERLLDAFKKLPGEVDIEWMRTPDNMRKVVERGMRAQERLDARVKELVEQKGMKEAKARELAKGERYVDDDVESTLGKVISFGRQAAERMELAKARGEMSEGSNANVTSWPDEDGRTVRRVLRIANGASVREVQEELAEQVTLDYMEGNGISRVTAYRYLAALMDWMRKQEDVDMRESAEGFVNLEQTRPELARRIMREDFDAEDVHALSVDEQRALERAVVEGVSRLMFSDRYTKALSHEDAPAAWANELMQDALTYAADLPREVAMAKALEVAQKEGWMPEAAKKLLGVGKDAVEAALAKDGAPTVEEYRRAWFEQQRRQAELDAAYGRGRVHDPAETDAFEERARAGQQEADVRRAAGEQQEQERGKALLDELAAEPENAGMSREEVVREGAKRVHDAREVEVASDPAAMEDAAFSNGACIEVTDERGLVCKSGVVRIDMLKLLPQFKLGADKETGEVSALGGEYFADHDPIRIFRNEKGELVVFSGRHRLAAAKRAGAERIVAYVYDGKTEEWARRYDIELNIRDNQASALEVAMYVRGEFTGGEALTPEQVSSVGIAREGKIGSIGLRIGRHAGESVMDALRNGKIEDSEALAIADFAPGNENVQRKGLSVLLDGGGKAEARARMEAELAVGKMAEALGVEEETDLWGNKMGNDAFLDYVAKYVVRRRNEISKDIQYLRTTATRKNAKAMAEKYGVDVTDPDGMKKALKEAEILRDRWRDPYTDSELMNEVKEAYRADHPGEEAASQSEQVWADYSRQVGEMREGVTHFSTSGDVIQVSKDEVPESSEKLRGYLKTLANKPFHNAKADLTATITGESAKKIAHAERQSAVNLMRLGYSEEDAKHIHRAAAVKIGELFEKAELYFKEDVYHKKDRREEAWHFFEPVDIDINGKQEAFLSNISVIGYRDAGERIFSLEMTIENPIGDREFTGSPRNGRHSLYPNGVSDVRLAAFDSFVKKEKAQIEKNARQQGLIPWRVNEQTVRELEAEKAKVQNDIDALLNKYDGNEGELNKFSRDAKKLHDLRERLNQKQAEIAAEYKPEGMADVEAPLAPNGEKSKLSVDNWLTVRTKAFKEWFGDWENAPENASKVVDENGEPLVVYHGTWDEFNIFLRNKLGSGDPDEAPARSYVGHWFSAEKMRGFETHKAVFLNIRNPKEHDSLIDFDNDINYGRESESIRQRKRQGNSYFKKLKEEDYDGVIIDYDNETYGSSYVAFKSEQVKSVDNRGTFDANNPVIHFSVAGMRARTAGANMEASYVDPADGKRKFVIPVKGARLSTGFTPGQLNAPLGGHKDVSLAALLHYPELYQAYPWLADMRVRLYNPTEKQAVRMGVASAAGYFRPAVDGEAAYIAVDSRYLKGDEGGKWLLNVLLHESQHAVQSYEGHARGAGFNSAEDALEYIDKAIKQREKSGVKDDWAKDNLAYLMAMRRMVEAGGEDVLHWAYLHSRGEQEARYTGEQKEGEPMAMDGSGLTTEGEESFATIAVNSEAKELGGVTFGGLSRFDYLLESRLAPGGEFNYDRTVYQMRDAIKRRAAELEMLGGEQDGAKMVAEAMAVMESVEGLLPNEYRYGLEAYKVYLSSYAKLYESGSPRAAGDMVPMEGWDKRMEGAYHNIAVRMLMGRMRADEMEFWAHRKDTLEKLESEQGNFQALVEEKAEKLRAQGFSRSERKVRREAIGKAWIEYLMEHGDFVHDVMQGIGEVRTDKLVAKFLERAALQLDAYRKDKTLGKIRRVVDRLTPLPGKDGKPVKGQMDAERYRKVVDFVRLMELTRGQRELFERERYTGDGTEKAWGELEPNDLITVPTYDADGKKLEIACTKQEFETYACFESMSAAQAEAAARALGEFVTTGRQAWENAQEAQRARIEELCAPAMRLYGETENEEHRRKAEEQRRKTPLVRKMLNYLGFFMNDAQFLDAISQVPGLEKWTQDAVYRVGKAHVYIEQQEKERGEFMYEAAKDACGKESMNDVRVWLDSINERKNSGVVLVPQEPDFAGQEHEAVRLQFMGLLRRKVKQKNFRPDTFAAALRYWADSPDLFGEYMPKGVLEEALEKYGMIGDAHASRYQGIDALNALMTKRELERFADLNKTAKERAEAAREKWLAERAEEGKPELAAGEPLELTQAQAAYRVLMAEQADYAENLRLQGYTPEVLNRLREFAGERVMRLAYTLREKMGERTAEIKDVYERVYGMPFPEVDNYFRAYFNVGYDVQTQGALSGEGVGAAAGHGGGVKILYHRNHRNAKIEPTMDVLSAFAAGMKEQDVLLGYGDLPGELSRILNYRKDGRAMSDALSRAIGSAAFGELKAHVENMQRIQPEIERHALHFTRVANTMAGAAANMILNWRAGTLAKQYTAIFNALNGSDIVDMGEYMAALGRVSMGFGKIRLSELAKRPELDGRFKGWDYSARQESLLGREDVKTTPRGWLGKPVAWMRRGMSLMEYLDVRANVRSSAALYDAVYRKMKRENKDATHEELDAIAMGEVSRALALKSQPLDWRQRSLGGMKRTMFTIGNFFLGGESVNTFARCVSLAARGGVKNWKKAAEVWLAHGAMLQVLTALYNFITDDKEQWEKRSAGKYLLNCVLGPLSGIPFLAEGVNKFALEPWKKHSKWARENLPWVSSTELLPYGDFERVYREVKKAWKDGGSWQDKTLAVNDVIRTGCMAYAFANHAPTSKAGIVAKGSAYALGGVSNILDFLLRTERAVEERW